MLCYNFGYFCLLRALPNSFTLGEGTIITQAFVLFLYNVYLQLIDYVDHRPDTNMQKLTVLLQVQYNN